MGYIQGERRNQTYLLPPAIDDYITEDHPVRFLDAFVAALNIKELGFHKAEPKETGRPAYDPADLLRLYLYGYLNRVRSSRRLEAEAGRNLELMWLMRNLKPDFKTIADFRKDNTRAIKAVCREFTLLCKKMDLFGGELVAIDGSKFQAVNSKERAFTKKRLAVRMEEIEAKIEAYLKLLDSQDQEEAELPLPQAKEMKGRIEAWKKRREQYQAYWRELEETGEKQITLTDPDSRMISRGGETMVGYNVQTAVDAKHHLIVEHEVTNEVTDRAQLAHMAEKAKAMLEVEEMEVVADAGYSDVAEIKQCEEAGVTVYVPTQNTSANRKLGLFGKERFRYEAEKDVYRCPAGKELTYRFATVEKGRPIRYYVGVACGSCSIKSQCTRNKENRRLTRHVDEGVMERMAQRMREHPEKMRLRKQIVEHPFGTIKHWMGMQCFLLRGLEKVGAEMSLGVLAYNLQRAIKIVGVKQLIAALT